jgi:hypothetical protein
MTALVVMPPLSAPILPMKARPAVIEISRSLARRLAAILRSSIRKPYFPHVPLVDFRADAQGLCVRVAQGEVAVEYRQPGSFRRATVTDNNYGSRGASVNLEMELDTTLVTDPPKL